jgi:hypothetical protein
VTRERRPNGNTTCKNGHTHSSESFDRFAVSAKPLAAKPLADLAPELERLRDYRGRLDSAVERLGETLVEIGDSNDPLDDNQIVDRAAVKLKMLYNMLLAAGVTEGILNAAVRG